MKSLFILSMLILGLTIPLCAQINWTKYSNDPIIPNTFDIKATEMYDPCVLLDNGTYKMWYTRKVAGTEKIAYATSTDGIAWTLVDTAVIIPVEKTTTRFDYKKVGQGSVIKDGDTLKMWYWGDGPNIGTIGLAWSMNGRSWTRVDGPKSDLSVFDRTADGSGALAVVTPCVLKVGTTYHMWYTRVSATYQWTIAYATSPDGLTWTNVPGTGNAGCVLGTGTSGSFDESLVAYPVILPTSAGFEMWYTARDNMQSTRNGYATSTDGINWKRYSGSATKGAILDNGGVCCVIKEGTTYKMWYGPYLNEFHYATAPITTDVTENILKPYQFSLFQNYPNPFNPSTVISYQLSAIGRVKLSVIDILGREIAVLVNELQHAGDFQVTFDAHALSSGMYYYKLTTGNFTQIKKMTLIK
jgi:predicted GH43/DUF377 family glycosyl hydrolase